MALLLNFKIIFLFIGILLCSNTFTAFAQQPKLATFHEIAQVIIDQKFQNQTSTSISVLSTSTQEIRVPVDLDKKIRSMNNVTAVVITNEDKCVLGVVDKACVLINISSQGFAGGINEARSKGKEIGDGLIDDINKAFKLDTKFHSVFIHVDDKVNKELNTTGVISGRGTVSIVYTFSKYDSAFLYEGLSAILIPNEIRDSGGFLNVAKKLADDPVSSVTFSIIPKAGTTLFQLQVLRHEKLAEDVTTINTLQFFGVEKLERSNYFNSDFFPLNSLVQVVILSKEPMTTTNLGSQIIPSVEKDGEKYPSDVTITGWFFDPISGDKIIGKYLFGKTNIVTGNDLKFEIVPFSPSNPPISGIPSDNSPFILVGIGIAAAIAVIWYLKNVRTKH